MSRYTCKFAVCLFLALAAVAFADGPASVTGIIHDHDGTPLMGAVVELFGANDTPVGTAFTDMRGHYAFEHLMPGRYRVYVAEAFYLPVHRSNVLVHNGSRAVVNLTLTTLFDAAQWFPAKPRPASEPADDWRWTLRSAANRPILRWSDDSADADVSSSDVPANRRHRLPGQAKVRLAVVSGSRQFGNGGLRQQTFIRVSQGGSTESIYRAQIAPESGTSEFTAGFERDPVPGTILRTTASYQSLPVVGTGGPGRLQSLQLRSGEQMSLGGLLMVQLGAQADFVQSMQALTAIHPFVSVDLHADQDTQISYRMATAIDMQDMAGMAPEFTSVPQVANQDGSLRMTRAMHQEVAVQRQIHGAQVEAAVFFDRMIDPVLNGYGDLSASEFATGNVLMDPVTGAFRSVGPRYSGSGVRVFASRPLNNTLWTAFEYTDGPAVIMPITNGTREGSIDSAIVGMENGRSQSVLVSMHGKVARSRTAWSAGYRWQPTETMTSVDAFNTGLSNPFLSLTIHQPLPCLNASQNASQDRLVLLLEMRNILAQGYRPIYIVNGHGAYFAQAARALTGGLAFSF